MKLIYPAPIRLASKYARRFSRVAGSNETIDLANGTVVGGS